MRSKTKLSALALLLGTALAIPALAQSGTVSQYPACADPPPKLTAAQIDSAHKIYEAGRVSYDEGDFARAVDLFKDAYRRDCSKAVLLVFVAKAYESKGDKAEAVNALEMYLKRAPNAEDAGTVRTHIDNLKSQIAAQPTATATTTTTATATATTTAPTATATTTPPPERGHTAGPWVLVGVGGAALIPGVILTILGQGKISDSKAGCTPGAGGVLTCPDPPSSKSRESDQNTGLLLRGFGIGLLAGGVALVAAGLIWHFVEPTGPEKTAKIRIVPEWQPGYGGLLFTGSF